MGKKKEMEGGKRASQSQCFATVRDTTNSPNIPEAPENQPEPGPSRLEHGSLDTEFIRKFRFI